MTLLGLVLLVHQISLYIWDVELNGSVEVAWIDWDGHVHYFSCGDFGKVEFSNQLLSSGRLTSDVTR